MARHEFPAKVRVQVIKRATHGGIIYCEKCNGLAKRFQIDHIRPDSLLGDPVIENAMLICEPCFSVKNPQDTRNAAKAKRREAKALGARPPPKVEIKSRGFQRRSKPEKLPLPPRKVDVFGRPT